MSKRVLLDTNIIVRFLVEDNLEQFQKAKEIFFKIENLGIEDEDKMYEKK